MPSLSKSNIYFFYQTPVSIKERTRLKGFIEDIIKRERKKLKCINFIFCTDKYLLQINRDFLAHDFYTDIITFPLSEAKAPIQAEIYVSVDRIRDNAKNLGQSFKRELHRVIFHGVLHLCGYLDKSKRDIEFMREREEHWLSLYGI